MTSLRTPIRSRVGHHSRMSHPSLKKAGRNRDESGDQHRHLSGEILLAQDNERKLVAQEIHDRVGQMLVAIKYRVESALLSLNGTNRESARLVEDLVPLIQQAIQETRRLQFFLRPSTLDELGLLKTVDWLCREFQRAHPGIRVEKDVQIAEAEIPEVLKITIFRILQEAMMNAGKHSGTGLIRLALCVRDGHLELEVRDDGHGFDLSREGAARALARGLGISSMLERAQLSGGVLCIESELNRGTSVWVRWPRAEPHSRRDFGALRGKCSKVGCPRKPIVSWPDGAECLRSCGT
ncbi:MAG: sensor histidine kinase [bacterium]